MSDHLVQTLMEDFATSTGLSGEKTPCRYVWTDAFAVCNFLSLHRATAAQRYLDLACALVGQVHNILGRHRLDDTRQGWISGLPEEEGRQHPTVGGLRIGKPLHQLLLERDVDCRRLLDPVIAEAELSLASFSSAPVFGHPAEQRLAFRELGLSIGIHAMQHVRSLLRHDARLADTADRRTGYGPLADQIEGFWSRPAARRTGMWNEHQHINSVMLATSLAPEGYVRLQRWYLSGEVL
jgi:hypothetical protein